LLIYPLDAINLDLKIKRTLCVGCEVCLEIAPDYLEIKDDDRIGKKPNVSSIPNSLAEELVDICPYEVFEIINE
jgi:ferredoxin